MLKTWSKPGRWDLFLVVLGLSPLLIVFFRVLWARPAYQFFPLALVGATLLVVRALRESKGCAVPGKRTTGRILMGITLALCFVANALWSPWLGMMTTLLVIVTVGWSVAGRNGLRAILPALLLLLIVIPPPLGWDKVVTLGLRSAAVRTSDCLLDLLGVVHVLEGNTILLPGKALLVEEACSGINSLLFCTAACLFWTLWRRRPLYWLLLTIPATCLFVTLGNTLRITAGAALNFHYQLDVLHGRPHEIFGVLLLLTYCALILSLDQLMLFLTQSAISNQGPLASAKGGSDPAAKAAGPEFQPAYGLRFAGWMIAFVGLGVFALRLGVGDARAVVVLPNLGAPRELNLTLPPNLAGWEKLDASGNGAVVVETVGVRSMLWRFQREGAQALVAVDYPLEGFHNVKSCYLANGWRIVNEESLAQPAQLQEMHTIKASLNRSVCQNAVVFHAVINEQGQWLSPPVRKGALRERFVGPDRAIFQPAYRIQVLTGGYAPLSDAMVNDAQELFAAASRTLSQQLLAQFSQANNR